MEYLTVSHEGSAELVRQKSRFIAVCAPVGSEGGALAFVEKIKKNHPLARHNVYAYRIHENSLTRYTDDGEPSGTAGMPALSVLNGAGVFDAAVVITRYFGGTLLGKGGLVSAYSDSAKLALADAGIVRMALCARVTVETDYAMYEGVRRAVEAAGASVDGAVFEKAVKLVFSVEDAAAQALCARITDICRGGAVFTNTERLFLPLNVK